MSKSLTDRTLTGLNWNMLNTYANAVITTIVGILLARLLTPKDFGLIGMVVIFTGFANLFVSLGMAQSVIKIKYLNEYHLRVATTLTVIASITIYTIFYFTAPLMAEFFKEQKLVPILRILALLFIIGGITTVSYAQMQKKLDFKGIMIISISTNCTYGAISATLAVLGYGVWSLVYGKVISSTLASLMTMKRYPVHWKPLIRRKEFKDVAGFGSGVSLSNILFYGTSNIDYLLIGRFTNPYSLGLYTRAFNSVTEIIERISGGIYNVIFPAFSLVQDEKEKLRRAYLRTVQTVSYILFPILFSAVIAGDYVIKGLYGSKWAGAINSFKILALAGVLSATLRYSGAVAYATGRVYAEIFRQLVYFLILGVSAYYLLRFGIEGVAFAVLIARVWMFLALNYLAIQIVESSWKEFLKTFIPGVANSVIMVLTNVLLIYVIHNFIPAFPVEIELLFIALIDLAVYIAAIVFMPSSIKGDTFDWLIEKYRKYIPSGFIKFYFAFNEQR